MTLVFLIILLLVLSGIATSRTIVDSIPGFNGSLPFTLETGYVGVGENEDVQLFYYFAQSERNPEKDPLMLWFTGGPGCSTLSAFFYQSGPLIFDVDDYEGGTPTLKVNPYAWTQYVNMIFFDSPVGTGFSYSRSQQGYYVGDYISNAQTYEFLRKWLKDHPQFSENSLYIAGDSYSGIPVPMLVQEIINGNEVGKEPFMNLQGYILGNPVTDSFIDTNARVPFAHRMALIPDELYQSAKTNCNGDYVNIDSSNEQCKSDIQAINELVRYINTKQVLEPYCDNSTPRPHRANFRQRYLEENYCFREDGFMLSAVWANDKGVREALQVREGTKGDWERCNKSLAYTMDLESVVPYHLNFTRVPLRALIYSGDHDMEFTYIGTQEWIRSLGLTLDKVWRAWFVDGQVAGYVKKLKNDVFNLTYATVKGAGHVAPEYLPKECYIMIDRWLAHYPL